MIPARGRAFLRHPNRCGVRRPDVQERVLVPTRCTVTYDRPHVRCLVALLPASPYFQIGAGTGISGTT